MEWLDTVLKLSQVGATGLLLIALFGAYAGWWVPGRTYAEATARENAWRELYLREKAHNERLSGQVRRDDERGA